MAAELVGLLRELMVRLAQVAKAGAVVLLALLAVAVRALEALEGFLLAVVVEVGLLTDQTRVLAALAATVFAASTLGKEPT